MGWLSFLSWGQIPCLLTIWILLLELYNKSENLVTFNHGILPFQCGSVCSLNVSSLHHHSCFFIILSILITMPRRTYIICAVHDFISQFGKHVKIYEIIDKLISSWQQEDSYRKIRQNHWIADRIMIKNHKGTAFQNLDRQKRKTDRQTKE